MEQLRQPVPKASDVTPDGVEVVTPPEGGLLEEVIELTSPLDQFIEATQTRTGEDDPGRSFSRQSRDPSQREPFFQRFLHASNDGEALRVWFGPLVSKAARQNALELVRLLGRDIALIDQWLGGQVNAILHHPRFQRLEASWRGLAYLLNQAGLDDNVVIRVLNVTWPQLARDQDTALEFDRSQLFQKVYEDEFGTPGGVPFSVLLADYYIDRKPGEGQPADPVGALRGVAGVAAAAFCPFISSLHPSMFDMDSFVELERTTDLSMLLNNPAAIAWRAFRRSTDARFVGLTLPRMLMRLPYLDDPIRHDGFHFEEDATKPDRSELLWGNSVYAFGAVLVRAFQDSGFFVDIRGASRDSEAGGLVTGLPVYSFGVDRSGVAYRNPLEVALADQQEKQLSDNGYITLCRCRDTEAGAFYAVPSIHEPQTYNDPVATANARLASMIHYVLCASRFAHCLKIMARDKIASIISAEQLQSHLSDWLNQYVAAGSNLSAQVMARYPLRHAEVQVKPDRLNPGMFHCVIHLQPHFQIDAMAGQFELTTTLSSARSR